MFYFFPFYDIKFLINIHNPRIIFLDATEFIDAVYTYNNCLWFFNVCHIFLGLSRWRRQLVYAGGEFVLFLHDFYFYYSLVFVTHSKPCDHCGSRTL